MIKYDIQLQVSWFHYKLYLLSQKLIVASNLFYSLLSKTAAGNMANNNDVSIHAVVKWFTEALNMKHLGTFSTYITVITNKMWLNKYYCLITEPLKGGIEGNMCIFNKVTLLHSVTTFATDVLIKDMIGLKTCIEYKFRIWMHFMSK